MYATAPRKTNEIIILYYAPFIWPVLYEVLSVPRYKIKTNKIKQPSTLIIKKESEKHFINFFGLIYICFQVINKTTLENYCY